MTNRLLATAGLRLPRIPDTTLDPVPSDTKLHRMAQEIAMYDPRLTDLLVRDGIRRTTDESARRNMAAWWEAIQMELEKVK